ncbi:response regulator [Candidatus Bathyarchaeota archaeon]|nr:response regulator [Candidatus Bathyarchaeota archaeon]MBT4319752.1 response regulator [Candidatus Bathyarchaeota archaeon]MBT4424975.1 response regulator [Candidatus Bathyarchaeota archaeon]MBT6603904.1 response regulator [Candidatus Bathyarchaeota archaeon]MBT7186799.1 response regulator [Candidatus Bathyarchaeota archaeon]
MARILVVDDDEDICVLVGRTLSNEGYKVDLAKDGVQALESMGESDYDLVVLDVMMPNKNGLEVIRDMKNEGRLRSIPILLFSALGTGTKMMLQDENQADDYAQKPFMKNDFLMKVKKLINKAK